jgi:hypothetical protein
MTRGAPTLAALALILLAGCSLLGGNKGLCFSTVTTVTPPGSTSPAVPVLGETCLTLPGGK